MKTENGPASAQSPVPQSIPTTLPVGGLYLSGMVIAVLHEDKEWDGEKYRQSVIGITDGEQTFEYRKRHDKDTVEANMPKLFQSVKVKVQRATTEKGKITVQGKFIY